MQNQAVDGSPSVTAPGRLASHSSPFSRYQFKRRRRCACGVTLCVLTLAVFAGGATLLRPPAATQLVAIGASYAENLTVPQNAFGWNGLQDIAQLAAADTPQRYLSHRLLRAPGEPIVVTSDFDWNEALAEAAGKTTVTFLSMHGGADEKGPYLLANDTSDGDSPDARLRLDGLWEALAAQPAEQRKLLLVDVTTAAGMWRHAVVTNSFAAGLKSHADRIAAIPNLAVICSSDEGQRSWIDLDECRTSFAHYAVSGLSGYAEDTNRDGRLTALELFAHIQQGVRSWCESRCHARQVPFMLPTDDEGVERARAIEVALAASRRDLQPPELRTFDTEPVVAAWNETQRLHDMLKMPESVAPLLWREYTQAVLRLEQLTLAGDDADARRVAELVESLQLQLEQAAAQRTRMLDPVQLSMEVTATELPSAIHQVFAQLWQSPPHQNSATWNKTLDETAPADQPALRRRLYDYLISRVLESPSRNLQRAAEIIRLTDDATSPRPGEIHFIAMLDQHLPVSARAAEFDGTLRLAVECRRDAARVLTSIDGYGDILSARSLPWVGAPLAELDRKRAAADDLLFAGPARFAEAHELLDDVADRYAAIRARVETVQHAAAVRDRALNELPYYCDWWANVWPETNSAGGADSTDATLANCWRDAHALANLLARRIGRNLDAAEFRRTVAELDETSHALETELAGLERQYRMWRAKLVHQSGPIFWNNRNAALLVPETDVGERFRVLAVKRRTASTTTSSGRSQLRLSSDEETRAASVAGAERRLRLALAALGKRMFELGGGQRNRFNELQREFAGDEHHSVHSVDELKSIGNELALRRHVAHTQLEKNLRDAKNAATTFDEAEWHRLADDARQALFWHPGANEANPIFEHERRDRLDFALWQAERTWGEAWNGDSPQQPPYYQVAALAYLQEARNSLPDDPRVERLQKRVVEPLTVALAGRSPDEPVDDVDIVSDVSPPVSVQLTTDRRCRGTGLVWVETGEMLELLAPADGNRVLCPLDEADRPATVSVAFRTAEPLATFRGHGPPLTTAVTLHGFYRGHTITKDVAVRLHPVPQLESTSRPRPDEGAIGVVAAGGGQQQTGEGGVALVLDASGSMGPVEGASTFKYQIAVRAVEKLLTEMPKGVQVSAWVFGEAIGIGKTAARPEETIRRIMRPVRWDPSDTKLLDELIARLSYPNVEPWNESPIGRAVLAAADDLPTVDGFRSIVVVTDGIDNRFERDLVANPSGRSLGDVLTDVLLDRGISLNVISFRVLGDQQTQAREQFRFVEQLSPPGRWWEADQQEGLENALRHAMGRNAEVRLQRSDESVDESKAPSELSLPIAAAGAVPKWAKGIVEPGAYRFESAAAQQPPLMVRGGDLQLLEIAGAGGQLSYRRLGYADTFFPWRPAVLGDVWQTSLLCHRQAPDSGAEMLVALERRTDLTDGQPADATELPPPADVWFEYGADGAEVARPLHWTTEFGYPAACWRLTSAANGESPSTGARSLRVWWTTAADKNATRALRHGHDFDEPTDLAGTTWDVGGHDVQILRMAVDNEPLPAADGASHRQNCLTVELALPPGQLVKIRPLGLDGVGAQHQFFPKLGRYVGRFWPVSPEQLSKLVSGVDFVAIDKLKSDAESRGQFAELTELGPPSPADRIPPREVDLFGGQ